MTQRSIPKALLWGVIASLAMSLFYLLIMLLTMTPQEVWLNFLASWYLLVIIIIGFGVQVGLWVFLRQKLTRHHAAAMSGASGTMSGTAMVACCAHHLADVLPVLGLSGAAVLLGQYQKPFLILGASINLLGVAYMLRLLRKHKKMMSD